MDVIDFYVYYSLEHPEQKIETCVPRLVSITDDPVFRTLSPFRYFDGDDWDITPPTYDAMSLSSIFV